MRFNKISVENFGPFKNSTSIDFTNNDGISIVWGRNGRGKTTLLNAFSFVLNNTVKDRNGKRNDYISFINEEGFAEGKYTFKVVLDVEDEGKKYRIVRSIALLPTISIPKTNNDIRTVLKVNCEGDILPDAAAEHVVKSIMTPEVSRFFLFDGELLSEYEELLNDNSSSGGSIKKSIEQILGMPVLTCGAADAKTATAAIEGEYRKVVQNEDRTKKHNKAIEEKLENLATQMSEKNRLETLRAEKLTDRTSLQSKVDDTAKLREFTERKKDIETKIEEQKQIAENERVEIVDALKEAWKWMITPVIAAKIESIQQKTSELHKKELESKTQSTLINYIEKAVNEVECPVCGHEGTDNEKAALAVKLDELKAALVGLSPEEQLALNQEAGRVRMLKSYLSHGERSIEIKKRYAKMNSALVRVSDFTDHDLRDVNNDLDALKKNASGADEEQAFKYYEDLASVKAEIKEIEKGIKEQEEVIAKINDDISKLDNKIMEISGNKDVALARKKVRFAEDVVSIFTKGIDTYREKLRKDVETDATNIFMAMNTEDDYGGLKINDNYGLTIVRKSDGKPVIKRSAGWEHMVAFALIGALHKNAPFDGPVIMDSPFYRLDKTNTASMVKALPLIANQVLMLPYPGEIDEIATRRDIGDSIIQELEITRISSNESTIKEL